MESHFLRREKKSEIATTRLKYIFAGVEQLDGQKWERYSGRTRYEIHTIWISLAVVPPVSQHLTEYSRFPLTACCRNPAARSNNSNAMRNEAKRKIICAATVQNELADSAFDVAKISVCNYMLSAPASQPARQTDGQAESNMRCGSTIMLLSRWLCGLLLRLRLCVTSNQN